MRARGRGSGNTGSDGDGDGDGPSGSPRPPGGGQCGAAQRACPGGGGGGGAVHNTFNRPLGRVRYGGRNGADATSAIRPLHGGLRWPSTNPPPPAFRPSTGAFFAQRQLLRCFYPKNPPETPPPPTEACTINSKQHRGCRMQDPGTRGKHHIDKKILRIWPILCTRFMTMARVVVGSGGSDNLCC